MTPNELLRLVASLRPHDYPDEVLLQWLDELEGRIAVEIHGTPAPRHSVRSHMGRALSVPAPYHRLYWAYLLAMMDLASGDKESYGALRTLFEESYSAYARRYCKTGGKV